MGATHPGERRKDSIIIPGTWCRSLPTCKGRGEKKILL